MLKIRIANHIISQDGPCFIIAEAGVNHNGKLFLAKKLVDVAKAAGADAVKFQTFCAEDLVTNAAKMAEYQRKNTGRKESQLKMLKGLELKPYEFVALKKYCDKKRIIFLSTPHTNEAVDLLRPLVPAYKVSSADLTNLPLLRKIARINKPVILSTGMATFSEINEAVAAIRQEGNEKIILLHCTTDYPCRMNQVNLRAMLSLHRKFGYPVGYSDHTLGILVSILAVMLGAKVIEKHFTLNKSLPGPDHRASLDPIELRELVFLCRQLNSILGNGIKGPSAAEQKIKAVVRKSLVARTDILRGECFTSLTLGVKRPGTGVPPKYWDKFIGRIARKNIKKDTLIKFKDLV